MCGSSHGLLVPACRDKAAGLQPAADSWDNRAPQVARLTSRGCQDNSWEIQSTPGGPILAPVRWMGKQKCPLSRMSQYQPTLLQFPPKHYTLQQCPVSLCFCSWLSGQAVRNSLLGLWRATSSPLHKKVTGFTPPHCLTLSWHRLSLQEDHSWPEGLPSRHTPVSVNQNRWVEDICQHKNPLK